MDLFLVTLKCADELARYELDETEVAVLMQFHMLKKRKHTQRKTTESYYSTNLTLRFSPTNIRLFGRAPNAYERATQRPHALLRSDVLRM